MKIPTTDELRQTISDEFGTDVTTRQIRLWAEANDHTPSSILNRLKDYKSGHGKYDLSVKEVLEHSFDRPAVNPVGEVATIVRDYDSLVPEADPMFVPFGNYSDLVKIIRSKIFYPIFITGLSGNGKTHSIYQACNKLKRDLIHCSITIETDQDDLLGGFRLVDGETAWHDGPVIEAMKRGAVLLLDELDLASNKILCLQSVLEGRGVYLKKINKWVNPAPGFNVIATANTKGKGSDSGRFIGTNILNEAFLERFPVTFEQEYPAIAVEKKILTRNFEALNYTKDTTKLVENLVNWADVIRKTYNDGGVDDLISTRRLVNIVRAYVIWENPLKAIQFCTNRFDEDTSKVFRDLYEKISGDIVSVEDASESSSELSEEGYPKSPNYGDIWEKVNADGDKQLYIYSPASPEHNRPADSWVPINK
ncbi:CobS [Synechococcus phage S-CRM01]|uniref:porphyrin biosynthesis n=1 Tax=Synechococcus phage S-CRM01 TaxID=1026955 RepID=UPI000209E3F8|nr:porphyrin biosynthesis [Synechococcus phage S-CRM01]AEC53113.1 CobS [Synechococcus phage S-CRM01]